MMYLLTHPRDKEFSLCMPVDALLQVTDSIFVAIGYDLVRPWMLRCLLP